MGYLPTKSQARADRRTRIRRRTIATQPERARNRAIAIIAPEMRDISGVPYMTIVGIIGGCACAARFRSKRQNVIALHVFDIRIANRAVPCVAFVPVAGVVEISVGYKHDIVARNVTVYPLIKVSVKVLDAQELDRIICACGGVRAVCHSFFIGRARIAEIACACISLPERRLAV